MPVGVAGERRTVSPAEPVGITEVGYTLAEAAGGWPATVKVTGAPKPFVETSSRSVNTEVSPARAICEAGPAVTRKSGVPEDEAATTSVMGVVSIRPPLTPTTFNAYEPTGVRCAPLPVVVKERTLIPVGMSGVSV